MNSTQTGQLQVSVDAVKGAKAYVHQYANDPVADSWQNMTCTQHKFTWTDFTAGTLYCFRLATVGTQEQICSSDIVGRMAA